MPSRLKKNRFEILSVIGRNWVKKLTFFLPGGKNFPLAEAVKKQDGQPSSLFSARSPPGFGTEIAWHNWRKR
jgi:hypothetical protein